MQREKFHTNDVNLSGIRSEGLIVQRSSYIVLAIVYKWQTKDKRPQRSNVNAKVSKFKAVNICEIQSSLKEAFEFCWSSLADEHNTLPKSTRRHVKLDKFIFGTPWLPDLLCKHWFVSSVWNFLLLSCRSSSAWNVPSSEEGGETDVLAG